MLMNYNRIKSNLHSYNLDKTQNSNPYKTKENLWIYGPPGSGKTYYATHLHENYYMKPQNKWWDGYKGEEVVIVDDFDQACMSHYLKIWADNYVSLGEIKNNTVPLTFKKLIVTSNYMPMALWPHDEAVQFAICRRFNFISIHGQFPNFRAIKIPNPIEQLK